MDSILDTVKDSLGVELDYHGFDSAIIMAINGDLAILNQLGVGPTAGFRITGSTETWSDFLGSAINLEDAKTHVCLKTKLIFDPPTHAYVLNAYTSTLTELDFRLMVAVDPPVSTPIDTEV